MRLNEAIAIEKGEKSTSYSKITDLHKLLQKRELMDGMVRTYRSKDEEGDKLPAQQKRVQMNASDSLKDMQRIMSEYFDIVATKDWGNCKAKADVIVDDVVVLRDVPVTYLLFLEKQLNDVRTFIEKLPVLDASEDWRFDVAKNCYVTEPTETHRTKKVPRNHVKYDATQQHPAQVEMYMEDVVVGFWTLTNHSGAMPASHVADLLERVNRLRKAVKVARVQANVIEVARKDVSKALFGYLLENYAE